MQTVRCLIGVLVIALVAMTLPAGGCCVLMSSHGCCRTQCLSAAPAAAIVKAPVVLAISVAPAAMRVIAVAGHQRFSVMPSTRPLESVAPLPLRI